MEPNNRQKIVSRLKEIRQQFPNANVLTKKELVEQFKSLIGELIDYLKIEPNLALVQQLKNKIPNLQEQVRQYRAKIAAQEQEELKQQLKRKKFINPVEKSKPQTQPFKQKKKQTEAPIQKPIIQSQEQNQLDAGISEAIVRQKPNVQWDDVAGLEQAKKVLQQAIILPIKFPQVFVGQRTPWRGILLYGPPGTGKTFLAKACATQMNGGTFFSVSASDLMSKYVGQSQKTLKALFRIARRQRPSIIFIDEIDSIAGDRSSEENEVSRRVKTQLLIQMQGVGNDCTDVLVLGATNLPWALDSAVRRRFQKRVYIPLPDIKGRMAMLKRVIEKNKIQIKNDQITQLAEMTAGYSGSDIANMANDALMGPVRVLDKTKKWIQLNINGEVLYAPFPPNFEFDPNAKYFQGTMQQLKDKGYKLYLPTNYQDFINALKNSKPSVSQSDLDKYTQFTKSFGMDG